MDEAGDGVLIKWAARGDEQAFRCLYLRHHDVIRRVCRRRLGNAAIAEEIVQEVFLKAFLNLPSLLPYTTLRPWLVTVARNLCTDLGRTASPQVVSIELFVRGESHRAGSPSDPTADTALSTASMRHLWAAMQSALSALDPEDRRLLFLRDVEGHSYDDLARAEGASKHALRNRVWRARAYLRDRLACFRDEVRALGATPLVRAGADALMRLRRRVARALGLGIDGNGAALVVHAIAVFAMSLCTFGAWFGTPPEFSTIEPNATTASLDGSFRADAGDADGSGETSASPTAGASGLHAAGPSVVVEFRTRKRDDAIAPNSTTLTIVVQAEGHTVSKHTTIECRDDDSDVLPKTGIVNFYC